MNLPNKLTIFRIILVPIMVIIPFFNIDVSLLNIPLSYLIMLFIFIIASYTDHLDGKIARKNNLVTTFGKFIDPIADKLLVNVMLIILSYKRMIPVVPCIFMIARDIVVDGCRMIAAQNGVVVSAGILGKLKTVLQIITICCVLLNNIPFELLSLPVTTVLIWFTAFVSCASGYSYFSQLKEYIFESI